MPFLISLFSTGGVILSFFAWIGQKVFTGKMVLPFQFALLGLIITVRMSIVLLIISLLITVFNKVHDLFDFFNNLNVNNPEIFDMPFKIMHNLGFFDALTEVLPLFSITMVTLFLVILTKLVIDTVQIIARELFQIVLILKT